MKERRERMNLNKEKRERLKRFLRLIQESLDSEEILNENMFF